jgi:hypothetical protein
MLLRSEVHQRTRAAEKNRKNTKVMEVAVRRR